MEKETISSLTANDLYDVADPGRKDRSKNQIDRVDVPAVHQDGNIINPSQIDPKKPITFDFKILSGKSHKEYYAHIRFLDHLGSTSPIKLDCSCADMNYRCNYVLNTKDALYNPTNKQSLSINQAPVVTNPNYRAYVCKHLLASFDSLVNSNILTGA